jgi:hypothetical protein
MLHRFTCRLLSALLVFSSLWALPLFARSSSIAPLTIKERLERGEVVVGSTEVGHARFVTGSVLINEPPERVWPIMVNPFEFLRKISPRMKKVEVVTDKSDLSVLRVTLDVVLIPHFTYVVESHYDNGAKVEFRRVGGVLKDFRGSWQMCPANGGTQTALTYSMYVDPGFPVPQWMVREGVKCELPRTLMALRARVHDVYTRAEALEPRTILAAAVTHGVAVPRRLTSTLRDTAE